MRKMRKMPANTRAEMMMPGGTIGRRRANGRMFTYPVNINVYLAGRDSTDFRTWHGAGCGAWGYDRVVVWSKCEKRLNLVATFVRMTRWATSRPRNRERGGDSRSQRPPTFVPLWPASSSGPAFRQADRFAAGEFHFAVHAVEAGHLQQFRGGTDHAVDRHLQFAGFLECGDLLAAAVQQVVGYFGVDAKLHAVDALAVGGQLHQPHDINAHALDRLHQAVAAAGWAL